MITQISASAGSGKTYAITLRFLALLKGALRPEPGGGPSAAPFFDGPSAALFDEGLSGGRSLREILAATFTNKAAAEMKDRILAGLKQEALARKDARGGAERDASQGTSRAGRLVSTILRHYDALNVRTIDSLLNSLVRLAALSLGLPPDFTPSFSPDEFFAPQYERLMDALSREQEEYAFLTASGASLRAALEDACKGLVLYGQVKGFQPGKRLQRALWEIVLLFLLEKPVPEMHKEQLFARIHALHDGLVQSARELDLLITSEELAAKAGFLRCLRSCQDIETFDDPPDSLFLKKDNLDQCLNKASVGKASSQAQWAYLRVAEAAADFAAGSRVYKSALQAQPLVLIARELAAMVLAGEKETGLLPALRLPILAGQVLREPLAVSEALCRMGADLRHILLDEFQDTSAEQWQALLPLVLESLSQGGGLTYVGDVKQAIYNWRGGDARLFSAALEEERLLAVAPNPALENLPYNWRSKPEIVRLNNAFFGQLGEREVARSAFGLLLPTSVTPPEMYVEEAADLISTTYGQVEQAIPAKNEAKAGAKAGDKTDDKAETHGLVRLYLARAKETDGLERMVKARLARLLTKELFEKWRPGDIAILVRAHDEAGRVAGWLTEWSIPVVTENSFRLDEHPLILSLLSVLTFLDYPADDLAFWNCISSPDILPRLGGPDLAAMVDWVSSVRRQAPSAQGAGKAAPRRPLYAVFRQDFPEIWERWFAPFVREAGLMSVYDSIREIIKHFRMEEDYPQQKAFLRRFLEVADQAEGRGLSSLSSFLQYWSDSSGEEKLPLPESMRAVRIMTIHQAKGLQFPVVILPFHHKQDSSDKSLVIARYNGLPLLSRLTPDLEEEYYQWRITADLERLNLIYVAWTRPVAELHAFITGTPRSEGLSATCRCMRYLVERLRNSARADLCQWEELAEDDPQDMEEKPSLPDPAHLLPEESQDLPASGPAHTSAQTPLRPEAGGGTGEETGGEARARWRPMAWLPGLKIHRSSLEETELTPRRRGILAHLCLEHLRLGPAPSQEDIAQAIDRAVGQAMRLFPLPLAEPENAARAMRSCLAWAAGREDVRTWLRHGRPEQSLMDEHGAVYRVDLLVDEGQGLCAVEYKTGKPSPEHEVQARGYLELLAGAQDRPARAVLVYLDEQFTREVRL